MAGKFMNGALVEFMPTFLIPIPNVIIFQYNPETIQHDWTQAPAAGGGNPLAVKGDPGESFSFTLAMDANDMISEGSVVAQGLAEASGIYTRLAALEMLQYPVSTSDGTSSLTGIVSSALGGGGSSGPQRSIPAYQVPTVLFIWGPFRILPVRVTSLKITEKLYDALLNPTHAEAQITLTVLTPDELLSVTGPLAPIANAAYAYSQLERQVFATANLANAVESIIGMLPT